jgi:hypothetical protein
MTNIDAIVATFVSQPKAAIESDTIERMRTAIAAAMGLPALKRVGRPPKQLAMSVSSPSTQRKRAPIQLCPVPGCKNPAAPIFGMVCSKHKDLPKATIKKYREARRAKKLAASGKAPPRRSPRTARKRRPGRPPSPKRQAKAVSRPRSRTTGKAARQASPAPVTSPASSAVSLQAAA